MRFFPFLILCIHFAGFSQKTYKVEYAYKLSNELDFSSAYPVWEEISESFLSTKKGEWEYVRMTVDAAEKTEQFEKALYYDSLLVGSSSANSSDWQTYFQLLAINNKHGQLSQAIDSARIHFPDNAEIKNWENNLPAILSRKELTSDYTIQLVTTKSKGEEYCAVPYKSGFLYVSNDDNSGIIARDYNRNAQQFTDICFYDSLETSVKARVWEKKFWGKLIYKNQWRIIKSSHTHEGPIAFDSDNKIAFVTRNQKEIDTVNRIKFARLELAVYKRSGNSWKQQVFPYNNKAYSTGHAVMDTTGWVIFASDKPGGFGGSDLYKTRLKNNKWIEPVNLGPSINSAGDELFPFVSNKGILYFSSNGWPGIGGLDVFYSSLKGNFPEPIGSPINTFADDFGIYIDDKTGKGFLSSNRTDWKDRIYTIQKPIVEINVIAILKTCKEKPMAGKKITVTDLFTEVKEDLTTSDKGEISLSSLEKDRKYRFFFAGDSDLSADSSIFSAQESGDYTINLRSNYTRKVSKLIAVSEDGKPLGGAMFYLHKKNGTRLKHLSTANGAYSFVNDGKNEIDSVLIQFINYQDVWFKVPPTSTNKECIDTISFSIVLKIKQGIEFIRLDMVLYNFDKSELRTEGKEELDKLVQYMKERPDLRVELSSHTDSRGTSEYNIELSNNRSQSCVNYIISNGISAKMITAKGYGESKLVNQCADGVPCSEEEHQANRRTELRFLTTENEILDTEKLEKKQ